MVTLSVWVAAAPTSSPRALQIRPEATSGPSRVAVDIQPTRPLLIMKRNSKITRKSKSRNNNRSGGRLTSISMLGGFSDRQRVTLRYTDSFTLAPSGVSADWYIFRGNSVFDPDFTSTGGQPASFDDYALNYQRYRVHGSRIQWRGNALNTGSGNQMALVVAARLSSSSLSTPSLIYDAGSMPYSKLIAVNPVIPVNGSMTMQSARRFGVSPSQFAGYEQYTAAVTTNPATDFYWHFAVYASDLTSAPDFNLIVTIDYDVEFYQRIDATLDLDAKYLRLTQVREAFQQRNLTDKQQQSGDAKLPGGHRSVRSLTDVVRTFSESSGVSIPQTPQAGRPAPPAPIRIPPRR